MKLKLAAVAVLAVAARRAAGRPTAIPRCHPRAPPRNPGPEVETLAAELDR